MKIRVFTRKIINTLDYTDNCHIVSLIPVMNVVFIPITSSLKKYNRTERRLLWSILTRTQYLLNNFSSVDGEWNAWTGWSACSVTCGSGRETRTRHCNNPAPEYGGKMCPGNTTESKSCYPAYCSGMGNFTFPHHSPRFFFIYVHTSTY